MENSTPKGPTRASITLTAGEFDGPDGLHMEVDFHGDFDPTVIAHIIIARWYNELLEQSDRAAAVADPTPENISRLLLPVGMR